MRRRKKNQQTHQSFIFQLMAFNFHQNEPHKTGNYVHIPWMDEWMIVCSLATPSNAHICEIDDWLSYLCQNFQIYNFHHTLLFVYTQKAFSIWFRTIRTAHQKLTKLARGLHNQPDDTSWIRGWKYSIFLRLLRCLIINMREKLYSILKTVGCKQTWTIIQQYIQSFGNL